MTTVQLTRELSERLVSGQERVELRSPDGRRIGYFVPLAEADAELWDAARHAFSEEEIAAARSDREGGLPLTDVLSRLEAAWPSR